MAADRVREIVTFPAPIERQLLRVFDLLFYVAYSAERERLTGYMFVLLSIFALCLGLTSLLAYFGLDLNAYFTQIYPIDLNDSVRSLLSKKSGLAVLFVFPVSALVLFMLYPPRRARSLIAQYDAMQLRVSSVLKFGYPAVIIVGLFSIGFALHRQHPQYVLIGQLSYLFLLRTLVVGRIEMHFRDQ